LAKPPVTETPLPTREEVLAFIAREHAAAAQEGRTLPGKIGKREIARAFGLKGADKIPLKRMLRELEAEGAVEKRGRTLHKKGQLPAVVLADITGRDRTRGRRPASRFSRRASRARASRRQASATAR
jgi:ribonuclease R